MQLNIILTGATGMVGEGVLFECLAHPDVQQVLMVNRKHYDMQHPKLTELLIPDFMQLDAYTAQLTGYNACFFCVGISSVGLKEPEYNHITYEITMHFAEKLAGLNPDMTFGFISGAHTDSSEQGKLMWARVKGKTENALMRLPFKKEYNFRPGFMKATEGQKNVKSYYSYIAWLYPFLKLVFPNNVSTLKQVGLAMINSVLNGYDKQVLEVKDIKELAAR